MCGIVGYIGKESAIDKLIKGLKTLEYRGYDSAGVAILHEKEIKVIKDKGRISNLEKILDAKDLVSNIGIAHTRWATHGIPSKENAHPHISQNKQFAVVHNGIIENYLELKKFLLSHNFKFQSDTDTEVIPLLLEYYYAQEHDVIAALKKVLGDIKGSYAILILTPLLPNTIIAAKKDSPLVLGKNNSGIYIASDIPAILEYTKDFYFLNDSITFYDANFKKIKKKAKTIDLDMKTIDKKGYEDYMLKEIHEQPEALENTLRGIVTKDHPIQFLNFSLSKEYLESLSNIYIVACGTAMHAGLTGKYAIEKICRIPVNVVVASEFRYQNPVINQNTLCIFISQSGETADTIAALKLAKKYGAKTITITNVFESSITREADHTIYTYAGPEIAVASTKAYISQVSMLVTLAIYISEILDNISKSLKEELLNLPILMRKLLENEAYYKDIAKMMAKETDLFYIGRGNDYNIALEGSLKLKEITYIHSEAYQAGELKHGPIALIENGTFVIGIITDNTISRKTLSNLEEVKSRGANIILITNQEINYKNTITIPKTDPTISPILAIIPLQFIAYFIAKEKGLDVDKPRNLAKSVTVE